MNAPLSYLATVGPRGDEATSLLWVLLIISIAVTVIIAVLVLVGVAVRRRRLSDDPSVLVPERRGPGLAWIGGGVGLTIIVLLAVMVWTVETMAAIGRTPPTALTVEVTGRQWWWQVRYLDDDASAIVTTANEIHIPVGEPVAFRLIGTDVIHSFWVPALGGKTDVIPGQTNVTWLQADKAGIYKGQCTEYCGIEHARMGLTVVAQTRSDFDAWRISQLKPVQLSAGAGAALFQTHCGACHTVRGTAAGGVLGPDLTHVMSRSTLAAGAIPNTIGFLTGWIAGPQTIKPGTTMPDPQLAVADLNLIRDYVETLN